MIAAGSVRCVAASSKDAPESDFGFGLWELGAGKGPAPSWLCAARSKESYVGPRQNQRRPTVTLNRAPEPVASTVTHNRPLCRTAAGRLAKRRGDIQEFRHNQHRLHA